MRVLRSVVLGLGIGLMLSSGAASGAAPPCERMDDACFASLEAELMKGGGVGFRLVAAQKRGEPRYRIEEVLPGGAADSAGLRPGDAIVEIDGRSTIFSNEAEAEATAEFFHRRRLDLKLGERITFRIRREGKEFPVEVTAGPRAPEAVHGLLMVDLSVTHGREWGNAYRDYRKRQEAAAEAPAVPTTPEE